MERKRIITLDDDDLVLEIDKLILEQEYDVRTCSTQKDLCIRVVGDNFYPHLYIIDHDLPGMKGCEMINRIRLWYMENHIEPMPKYMLRSARIVQDRSQEEIRLYVDGCLCTNADIYLPKPYIINDLKKAIEEVLMDG